ncbi:MAG TPA: response regulator [Anaerolineales bacterium]|nr:response regulator [Anaerolineales bacterium]
MAKILYIEDISDNATLARKVLTARGHEFLWAETAESGLEMALAEHPDLILLDLGLPDVDGQTLSVWLRSEPELEHVPLVALTAWPEEVARKMVEAYNLDGYIGKPFNMHHLLKLISDLLAR